MGFLLRYIVRQRPGTVSDEETTEMLTEYVNASLKRAQYERMEDDEGWFATIPGFAGLWAHGHTIEETRQELRSTLEDWILVGVRLGHQLPVVDGIDLNVRDVA